jgi:hypothetical protein
MKLIISLNTARKLKNKHGVSKQQIMQCFANFTGYPLTDNREQHKTNPPTQWFISETNAGKRLKIVFIQISTKEVIIKTAYKPNKTIEQIYSKANKSQ